MQAPKKRDGSHKPLIVDLYSGAGGLSLGAARSGFGIAAAVEIDPFALETHKRNFPLSIHIDRDVRRLSGERLLELARLKSGQLDGLIGGPPCQGFSYIGVNNNKDPRNALFDHFFRLVSEIQPKFFIAENVPGILSSKFCDLRRNALGRLLGDYTILEPLRVAANEYGVPTTRTRIFFIGFKSKFFNGISRHSFEPSKNTRAVYVRNALKGLPSVVNATQSPQDEGWCAIDVDGSEFLQKLSGRIPKGIGNPRALERYLEHSEVSGCVGTVHEPKVVRRFERLEPGQVDPVSRAPKLDPWNFCPTLRAGTGSDRGSYQAIRPIHYKEPRVITPREGARLQGFPDWFVFHRTKWHSFRQIGNSVSPLVAEALLNVFASQLYQYKTSPNNG